METVKVGYETSLNEYVKQERTAVQLINSIGELMFNKGVELVLFRNHLCWYDNEFGYTKQVIRIAKFITKVRRLIYY